MKIRKFEERDFQSLIEYNTSVFNNRDQIEESIRYRFFYNPRSVETSNEILIALDDNNIIIGQILMMPVEFNYKGNVFPAYFGMDYFVNKEYRNSLAGMILANKAKDVKYHFGIAFTVNSSKIFRLFKEKNAGNLEVYFRPNVLLPYYNFISRSKKNKSCVRNFPFQVKTRGGVFQRIYEPDDILSFSGSWNNDLIEFSRNRSFLEWRFFFYPDKYIVYKYISTSNENLGSPIYFVVRPVLWKRMNCILLVDYRFDLKMKHVFRKILDSTTKLSTTHKFEATITGCSLPGYKNLLRSKLYFKIGEKREILTNFQLDDKDFDNKIDEIFVTFADSDSDFYFGNGKW